MWLKPDCSTNVWVEEGITLWWDPIIHSGAYETFFAYNTPGQSYAESAQEYILPTNERADFRIFRGGYANTWTVRGIATPATTGRPRTRASGPPIASRWEVRYGAVTGMLIRSTCMDTRSIRQARTSTGGLRA